MGSGVALLDYDGDGDLDVYFLQSAPLGNAPSAEAPGNRLFRNELTPSGRLRFTDVSREAGVADKGFGMGAAVGDYDNDGDPDLYITNFGPNVLFRNEGDGTFTDVTNPALAGKEWSASASFFDYDRDGDLDLFVTNYVDFSVANNKQCFDPTGARDYCTPKLYNPVPDRLYRNDGGLFVDVTAQAGIDKAFGNGLGVICADFDGDGWTDVYVANDAMANQLWRNRGDGTFVDQALPAGAAFNADGLAEAGMGATVADFDRDGDEDIFLSHLSKEKNTLYLNNGHGQFRDETVRFGLAGPSMPYTGFGTHFADFNQDGKLDLFVANGDVTAVESMRGSAYPFAQPNQLYLQGEKGFRDATAEAGEAFSTPEVSRGAAFGDLDHDGDLDIVVSNSNGPARLFLNQSNAPRTLRLQLEGVEDARDAYGARVGLLVEGEAPRWERVHTDGSYLSASSPWVIFALSDAVEQADVTVVWLDGRREVFRAVKANVRTTLRQGQGTFGAACAACEHEGEYAPLLRDSRIPDSRFGAPGERGGLVQPRRSPNPVEELLRLPRAG
ncbi:MAG: CRTAC1 family protein [Bryobacterales bacterium]